MEPKIITLENATANAMSAVEITATCQPVKRGTTLAERWAEFWENRHIAKLQRQLQTERQILGSLAERASDKKHEAQLNYGVKLAEIDKWRDSSAATCKHEIAKIEAELAKRGV